MPYNAVEMSQIAAWAIGDISLPDQEIFTMTQTFRAALLVCTFTALALEGASLPANAQPYGPGSGGMMGGGWGMGWGMGGGMGGFGGIGLLVIVLLVVAFAFVTIRRRNP
jgi:hypothetical protein